MWDNPTVKVLAKPRQETSTPPTSARWQLCWQLIQDLHAHGTSDTPLGR